MNAFFIELRKHTFLALIPIVVLFSLSLAYLCRGVLLLFLTPDVQTSASGTAYARRPVSTPIVSIESYKELVTGNFFRGSLAPPPGETALGADGNPAPPDTGEGEEMRITGTLSGHWSFARVTILEKGKQNAEEFATGETIAGYKVKAINLTHVVLEKGGSSLKVEIGQTPGEARAKLGAAAQGPAPAGSGDAVRKILSRQDVNRKLADPTAIYKNARFGPFMENNAITGYKIYSIGNEHIFYSLGARNGDVIRRVNGMPLNDTVKMLEMWNSIKTTDKVSVDVDRGGKILTYEFIIRN